MAELQAMRAQQAGAKVPFIAQILKMTEIQEVEIAAMAAAAQGNEAITIMRQATALEEALPPPPGPPLVIKPAHELFGEILLRAKRPKEAAEQFATSLRRHKNRARSLLGAAALPLRAEMPKARRTSTRNSCVSGNRLTRSCQSCVRRRIT